jgi:hypothetical protein
MAADLELLCRQVNSLLEIGRQLQDRASDRSGFFLAALHKNGYYLGSFNFA